MTSRERFLLALNHKEADRIPACDAFWGTTIERWKREGLPEGKSFEELFGFDGMASIGVDISFQVPSEVVEETDEYVVTRSGWGVVSKSFKGKTSTPKHMDFLVHDRKSWEENKERLAYNDSRVNFESAKDIYKSTRESDVFLNYGGGGLGFDLWQILIPISDYHVQTVVFAFLLLHYPESDSHFQIAELERILLDLLYYYSYLLQDSKHQLGGVFLIGLCGVL